MLRSTRRLCAVLALTAMTLGAPVTSLAVEETWTISFKDADIHEVIQYIANITGRTVVIDPRIKGRVKIISQKPLNLEDSLDLFRTVLEIHDFSLIEVNDIYRVVPLKDARSSPVPVADHTSTKKGFLTQVIQLRNIAAAKVLPSIRPLVPQHSHLSAYDPSNAIIITDSAENIARIRSLIERLDQSATPITEIVELKFASATDLTQVLQNISKTQKKNQAPQNALRLTADKRNNAILVTGEDLQRARVKKLIQRLDRPRAQTGNVRVVYLDYANSKAVAETLTKVMANLSKLGPGGKADAKKTAATVEADEDTNSLLITASGDELQTLMDVVARLDIRRAQVLVEAIIAEVSDGDTKNLGVEWMYNNTKNGMLASSSVSGPIGKVAGPIGQLQSDPDDDDGILGLGAAMATTTGQLFGLVGGNNNETFLSVLNALETNGKTNILSTPILLTMDNHEATFTVGDNIPIKTGSQSSNNGNFSPFTTIQREDVGIKLTVTPQVNAGNKILLDISQEVSSVNKAETSSDGIITKKRKIETQILVASGEIIVLGGLIENKSDKTEQRVPFLGRIPIIGALFRNKTSSAGQTNLMVFIRATVMRSDEDMNGVTADKYNYMRDRQDEMRDNGFLRLDSAVSTLPDISEYYRDVNKKDGPVIETPAAKALNESTKSGSVEIEATGIEIKDITEDAAE